MDDVETTNVLLAVGDDTTTTPVTTTSDEDEVASIKLDKVGELALLNVEANGVVDFDRGVRVADGAAVVRDDEGNALVANRNLADFEELVGSLLSGDAVDREATLDVVKQTEVLARLLDRDDI